MIGYSFDYCLAHGLPGYDEWKTRSPYDDDDYRDDERPEWDDDDFSLEAVATFYDTHEPDGLQVGCPSRSPDQ